MGCITWSTKMAPASLSSPYSSIYAQMIDAPMEDPTTRTSYNTSQEEDCFQILPASCLLQCAACGTIEQASGLTPEHMVKLAGISAAGGRVKPMLGR